MEVTLPKKLDAMVRRKVHSGRYESAGEVIREGLRLLEERDRIREIRLEELRQEVAVGAEQIRRGKVVRCKSENDLTRFFEDIKARGRRRSAKRGIA